MLAALAQSPSLPHQEILKEKLPTAEVKVSEKLPLQPPEIRRTTEEHGDVADQNIAPN
jgi:hypothetical protein